MLNNRYLTYSDVKNKNPYRFFAEKHGMSELAITFVITLCNEHGATKTHQIVAELAGNPKLSIRDIRYITKVVALHNELLSVLKYGGTITEQGIAGRKNFDPDIIDTVGEVSRVRGTYRELIFRRA